MELDLNVAATGLLMAFGNIGAFALLVQKYAKNVDDHAQILPKVTMALEQVSNCLDKHNKYLDELFARIDEHSNRLGKIETIHEMRGCDQPLDPLWKRPSLRREGE